MGRAFLLAVLLAVALPARAADPALTFLMGMAQEILNQPKQAAAPAAALPEVYPGTTVRPALMKRLIDDCFLYLSPPQRAEIFDALNAELLKPANFAMRAPMIEYFVHRALQVRAAQVRLSQLSPREQEFFADEFRQELKTLPEEQATELRGLLERGLLPVPTDLNQRLLAAFN